MTSAFDSQTQTPPPTAAPSATRSVAKATAGIGTLHFIRFLIGFAAQPLIAHNLGLSWPADVYAVSTDIIQRFWLVFEKVINPAFLPQFIASLKEEGEEEAWKLASTALWLFLALLILATGGGMLIMPWLVSKLSPKAGPQELALTVSSARMLLLALTALGVSSLTYTILNGYKRFVWAALGDALWKVGVFLGAFAAYVLYHKPIQALMTAQKHAPSAANQSQLLELSLKSLQLVLVGFFIGSILKLVPHVFAIGSKWRFLRPRVDFSSPRVQKMLALAVPLLLGIVISESRGFYLTALTGNVETSDAPRFALKLSRLINDTFIQVFPYALSIGIFPFLADLARERDRQPMTDLVVRALRVCFFVFVPLTGILIALSKPLMYAMWSGGRLTTAEALTIVPPFIAYALGMTGFACESMLGQTFYALTRTWAPTLIGLAISVVWILIAWFGVQGLGVGLVAVAGAEAFSKSLKCIIMWYMLKPHLGAIKSRDNLLFFGQLLLATVVAAAIAHFAARVLAPGGASKGHLLIGVTVSGILAIVGFVIAAKLLRIEELNSIRRRKRPTA